jgi:hypothetical protein
MVGTCFSTQAIAELTRELLLDPTGLIQPHGLLGLTAWKKSWIIQKSTQGEGVIEGHWLDYQITSNDLHGDDFAFNKYALGRWRWSRCVFESMNIE